MRLFTHYPVYALGTTVTVIVLTTPLADFAVIVTVPTDLPVTMVVVPDVVGGLTVATAELLEDHDNNIFDPLVIPNTLTDEPTSTCAEDG